jgi:predicted translin family RNA/ssDNA-binding protein
MCVRPVSGELMRYALNSINAGDRSVPARVCSFMDGMHRLFESLTAHMRVADLDKKLTVMLQSLVKCEQSNDTHRTHHTPLRLSSVR